MCRAQSYVGLLVLYVGLARSWDIAISQGDLLEFYTNNTKIDTVRFNSHNLTALDYDEVNNMVLYVDKKGNNDTICAHHISTKLNQCLIERNGRNIRSLSFDPATQLLFFTDTNERSINWISLRSGANKHGNLLIKTDHGIPTDVAVDSCGGYVYWININLTTPRIERARFNGSEREVIINVNSFSLNTSYKLEPHSLTIDQHTQKMYWIEPKNNTRSHICYTDLNGKNKICHIENSLCKDSEYPSSNTLTVSKTALFWAYWCFGFKNRVEKLGKIEWEGVEYLEIPTKNIVIGIVANYKIRERIQDIKDCKALTNLELNNSDGPFCVHGVKVIGQSHCKCLPGYIGDRCDVSVCDNNYCFQGNCSFNNEGLPKCSCNAGYSGERCEVDKCLGYCRNDGVCSFNEKSEPVCQCKRDHAGDRCEVSDCFNYCLQGICSINDEGRPNCRCNAGYSGERCEVAVCHGFCMNSGVCSLNEEDEPSCECEGSYEGPRCESVQTFTFTFTNIPRDSEDTNRSLTDLLASWRKPKIVMIDGES